MFLNGIKERGIGIPSLVTSDARSRLTAALKAALNCTHWRRCKLHFQQGAEKHFTKQHLKAKVAADIRAIFNAAERAHAEERLKDFLKTYSQCRHRLVAWAGENLPDGSQSSPFPKPTGCACGHLPPVRT